jgi:F-box-like
MENSLSHSSIIFQSINTNSPSNETVGSETPHEVAQTPNLIFEIFSHLTAPEIGNARLVCKEWNAIGNGELFWDKFTQQTFKTTEIPQKKETDNSETKSEQTQKEPIPQEQPKTKKEIFKSLDNAGKKLYPKEILENIRNLNLNSNEGQRQLFILLELLEAYRSLDIFLKDFDNLNIKDEKLKLKIAVFCGIHDPEQFRQNIEKFYFEDETKRIELLNQILKKHSYIVRYLDKFKISDKTLRCETAKKFIQQYPQYFANDMHKFNIEDEKDRILFARYLCASNADINGTLVRNFQDFNISDENIKRELANKIFEKNPHALVWDFDCLNFQSEDVRIEFAKKLCQKVPTYVAMRIEKFNIQNEEAKLEIARMIQQQKPGYLEDYFKDFKFQNEEAAKKYIEAVEKVEVSTKKPVEVAKQKVEVATKKPVETTEKVKEAIKKPVKAQKRESGKNTLKNRKFRVPNLKFRSLLRRIKGFFENCRHRAFSIFSN